jgi:uncharacterized protein YggU (UPF0235/DUF167 family)
MPTLYRVKAHPGAKEDRLERRPDGSFEVWVRAPAEAGRANAAVLALLAGAVGLPAKALRVVKGAASPSKLVAVLGS